MIDYILIISFFIYLIHISFRSYKEVSSINAFSLGIKSVSIFALGSTILATYISGSGFFLDTTEFYKNGGIYFLASLGMCASLFINGWIIVPKMERFLGKLSVASIMGEEYGQTVRVLTAIFGIIKVCGGIFIQFKIMGTVLYYLFPFLSENICIVISSFIVIGYTYAGGIISVVGTDKIQVICFTLSLIIGITLFDHSTKTEDIDLLSFSMISLEKFIVFSANEKWEWISLFLYFLLPSMSPTNIQRISMGFNIDQVQKAYYWSSLGTLVVLFLSCWLAYLIYTVNPNLSKGEIIPYLLNNFSTIGTKSILVIGIISMCMSTADSNLNIAGVLVGNDTWIKNSDDPYAKLQLARKSTILIGLLSLIFIFWKGSLLDILLLSGHFYMPIVTVPLLAVIFNFKTTERCCLITMGSIFCFIIIFKFILFPKFNIIPLSMALNLIILVSSHYIIEKWNMLERFGFKSSLK